MTKHLGLAFALGFIAILVGSLTITRNLGMWGDVHPSGQTAVALFHDIEMPDSGRPNPTLIDRPSRTRAVEIDLTKLIVGPTEAGTPRLFSFEIEKGVTALAKLTPHLTASDIITWSGAVDGRDESDVVLVVKDSGVDGTIQMGDTVYTLTQVQGTIHIIGRHQQSKLPREAPPPRAPRAGPRSDARPAVLPTACTQGLIDVLIYYTPAARQAAGGKEKIERQIALAIAQTNLALQRSSVPAREVRLVGTQETPYQAEGDIYRDLDRLRIPGDGFLDEVAAGRDRVGADLVGLIVEQSEYCGLGYVKNSFTSGADSAFFVVVRDCATTTYSFSHELGHNLGLDHERGNAAPPLILPFAFGYQDRTHLFRDIMAYDCAPNTCPRILNYSNPSVRFKGWPTGVDHRKYPDSSADAAQAARLTTCSVADYRKRAPA